MVVFTAVNVRNHLAKLWDKILWLQHELDNRVMQDLEIEGHCVLSGTFMILCRVCMAIVLLVTIGFALDEVDIEHAAQALARFLNLF